MNDDISDAVKYGDFEVLSGDNYEALLPELKLEGFDSDFDNFLSETVVSDIDITLTQQAFADLKKSDDPELPTPETPTSTRFAKLSDDEIKGFQELTQSKATKQNTKWGIKILTDLSCMEIENGCFSAEPGCKRKLGSCCGGSWTRCHGRPSDEVEKDSHGSTPYSCVDPEARTSQHNIELRDITTPKKPRRSGKLEDRKTIHSTGTISETLIQRLTGKKDDLESPWSKYYQPDPELARRYLEEKATMSENQRSVGSTPRGDTLPSAPNLYPMINPMMYE
uniref:Uncharacterized protein n=1 Tax=Magallana gigas TaxID=29159 RepID=K1QGS7_MAGGI